MVAVKTVPIKSYYSEFVNIRKESGGLLRRARIPFLPRVNAGVSWYELMNLMLDILLGIQVRIERGIVSGSGDMALEKQS